MNQILEDAKMQIIRSFNNNPKKGINIIEELCRENDLDVTKEVANFFFKEKTQLNLEFVGDYLGSENNKEVLKHFVAKLDFKDKSFVQGMRDYLDVFKLPGEAQKIDRLVEAFGTEYCKQNPGKDGIENGDAAYVLAFQTIMLNTDLHNPSVKNKMTLDGVKRNLQGVNNGKNFPDNLLKNIYGEIQNRPFSLNFVKTTPGYTIHDNELKLDQTFDQVNKLFEGHSVSDLGKLKINDEISIKIDKPKTWLAKFTGYQGTMTITDTENSRVAIQVYQPSVLANWFLGDKPKIIVQPMDENAEQSHNKAVKMAARIMAGFNVKSPHIEASYDYLKQDLLNAYVKAREYTIDSHLLKNPRKVSNTINTLPKISNREIGR